METTKTINLELRGKAFEFEMTGLDSLFFSSLMFPKLEDFMNEQASMTDMFNSLNKEDFPGESKEEIEKRFSSEVMDKLLARLNYNVRLQESFCQRCVSICPELNEAKLIRYVKWADHSGKTFIDHAIRLGIKELFWDFLIPVIEQASGLLDADRAQTEAMIKEKEGKESASGLELPSSSLSIPMPPVKPPAEITLTTEGEEKRRKAALLRAQLAELELQVVG